MQPVRFETTLEPLRTLGRDSVRPARIPEIRQIHLLEIEVAWEDTFHHVEIRRADDLFNCAAAGGSPSGFIPRTGRITRAVFSIEFSHSRGPVTLQIAASEPPPLPEGSDRQPLHRWLIECGFCE